MTACFYLELYWACLEQEDKVVLLHWYLKHKMLQQWEKRMFTIAATFTGDGFNKVLNLKIKADVSKWINCKISYFLLKIIIIWLNCSCP